VLALTADAFPAQHARYRAAGMSEVLAKPFTEAELLAKLVAVGPANEPRPGDDLFG
jgi:CheY-like chemotaxis protein